MPDPSWPKCFCGVLAAARRADTDEPVCMEHGVGEDTPERWALVEIIGLCGPTAGCGLVHCEGCLHEWGEGLRVAYKALGLKALHPPRR